MTDKRTIRCAIYTRKSSEEGLEQSFNSLDAQREACQSYVLSQRQEGWRALDIRYDDGGFSGGSMERPALKRLLADIDAKKVDTVVVYKVDRLTRSLADFAKIVEAFDSRGVSFVSVTQQFNTTSSMGRLTLNVLLSFAQFEREVTGERIRDKIAASKLKGMWMGGVVPVGYDLTDHRLIVNQQEARHVREIYQLYLDLGCVKKLKEHLDKLGAKSKLRVSRSGIASGGTSYARGALYRILQNRIYIGETPHKEKSYPGQHDAILDKNTWAAVRALMSENLRSRRHGTNAAAPSLLRGLIYDEEGSRFTPSHAVKNGRRYRYYISQRVIKDATSESSQPRRIPARELEKAVLAELKKFFSTPDLLVSALEASTDGIAAMRSLMDAGHAFSQRLDTQSPSAQSELLARVAAQIVVSMESVEIRIRIDETRRLLLGSTIGITEPQGETSAVPESLFSLKVAARLKRCSQGLRLILSSQSSISETGQAVPSLLKAICRGHQWIESIIAGNYASQKALAAGLGLSRRYVDRIITSAFLAPEIVEVIIEGRQSPDLTVANLLNEMPLSWIAQNSRLEELN